MDKKIYSLLISIFGILVSIWILLFYIMFKV